MRCSKADLAPEELPYLGILKTVLGYVDTASYSYAELANEINIHTGGIGAGIGFYPNVRHTGDYEMTYEVRTKVVADKLPDAMRLIREILLTSKLADAKRLHEILAQTKTRLQTALSASGDYVASMRAMSYFSQMAACQDATGGIACYRVVADYEEHFEEKKDELIKTLTRLVKKIFTARRMKVSITCEEKDYAAVEQAVLALKGELYPSEDVGAPQKIALAKKNEGFMDASQVQYVARAGNFVQHGFSYHGALKILKVILGYDYLWNNIRVKGGAYGCGNGCLRNGDMYFASYRDPNLEATNEIYDGIPAYLEGFTADEREMTKYIIGTISDLDIPLNPSAKGARSMTAYLQELSEEELQRERDEVLLATQEDIRGLRDLVASVLSDGNFCVIGNEETLRENRELFGVLEELG